MNDTAGVEHGKVFDFQPTLYPSSALHSSLKTFSLFSSNHLVRRLKHIQLISLKSTVKHIFGWSSQQKPCIYCAHRLSDQCRIYPLFHSTHANFTRWILSGSCYHGMLLKLPLFCPGCSRAMLTYILHHSRSRTKTCTSRTAAAHALYVWHVTLPSSQ